MIRVACAFMCAGSAARNREQLACVLGFSLLHFGRRCQLQSVGGTVH